MKGLVPLLEAIAKLRVERDDVHLVVIGKQKDKSKIPAVLDRLGLEHDVEFVSGVAQERIIELYAEAEIAVVPSLYEGFSLPAIEAMACGVPLVATTGGALPEVVGPDGIAALTVPPNDPSELAIAIGRMLDDPELRARIGRGRPRPGARSLHLAALGRGDDRELVRTARRAGTGLMLTVDFDRLDLQAGDRLLDMGCGGGRHAFAGLRRGATVIAFDYSEGELKDVRGVVGAMLENDEIPAGTEWGTVNGDALNLPFPDSSFDVIVASEVLEHLWATEWAMSELVRVLRPGGRIAVTVPTELPERICWALDSNYHDVPGGHVRIFKRPDLEARLVRSGPHAHRPRSPARPPLPVLVDPLRGWREQPRPLPRPQVPQPPGEADHRQPALARRDRPGAEPAHRQEPHRVRASAAG